MFDLLTGGTSKVIDAVSDPQGAARQIRDNVMQSALARAREIADADEEERKRRELARKALEEQNAREEAYTAQRAKELQDAGRLVPKQQQPKYPNTTMSQPQPSLVQKAVQYLKQPVQENAFTKALIGTNKFLTETLPGGIQKLGAGLQKQGDQIIATPDRPSDPLRNTLLRQAEKRVTAGLLYGVAGAINTLGQALIDQEKRPFKAAGEYVFGAFMAHPAGVAFTGALSQPEIRDKVGTGFQKWEETKHKALVNLGIKNEDVQDAFSVLADLITFHIVGKGIGKTLGKAGEVAKKATTDTVKVTPEEAYDAFKHVFNEGKKPAQVTGNRDQGTGDKGQGITPPNPPYQGRTDAKTLPVVPRQEVINAVREILKNPDKEFVGAVLENGFSITRPRASWQAFSQQLADSLKSFREGNIGLNLKKVGEEADFGFKIQDLKEKARKYTSAKEFFSGERGAFGRIPNAVNADITIAQNIEEIERWQRFFEDKPEEAFRAMGMPKKKGLGGNSVFVVRGLQQQKEFLQKIQADFKTPGDFWKANEHSPERSAPQFPFVREEEKQQQATGQIPDDGDYTTDARILEQRARNDGGQEETAIIKDLKFDRTIKNEDPAVVDIQRQIQEMRAQGKSDAEIQANFPRPTYINNSIIDGAHRLKAFELEGMKDATIVRMRSEAQGAQKPEMTVQEKHQMFLSAEGNPAKIQNFERATGLSYSNTKARLDAHNEGQARERAMMKAQIEADNTSYEDRNAQLAAWDAEHSLRAGEVDAMGKVIQEFHAATKNIQSTYEKALGMDVVNAIPQGVIEKAAREYIRIDGQLADIRQQINGVQGVKRQRAAEQQMKPEIQKLEREKRMLTSKTQLAKLPEYKAIIDELKEIGKEQTSLKEGIINTLGGRDNWNTVAGPGGNIGKSDMDWWGFVLEGMGDKEGLRTLETYGKIVGQIENLNQTLFHNYDQTIKAAVRDIHTRTAETNRAEREAVRTTRGAQDSVAAETEKADAGAKLEQKTSTPSPSFAKATDGKPGGEQTQKPDISHDGGKEATKAFERLTGKAAESIRREEKAIEQAIKRSTPLDPPYPRGKKDGKKSKAAERRFMVALGNARSSLRNNPILRELFNEISPLRQGSEGQVGGKEDKVGKNASWLDEKNMRDPKKIAEMAVRLEELNRAKNMEPQLTEAEQRNIRDKIEAEMSIPAEDDPTQLIQKDIPYWLKVLGTPRDIYNADKARFYEAGQFVKVSDSHIMRAAELTNHFEPIFRPFFDLNRIGNGKAVRRVEKAIVQADVDGIESYSEAILKAKFDIESKEEITAYKAWGDGLKEAKKILIEKMTETLELDKQKEEIRLKKEDIAAMEKNKEAAKKGDVMKKLLQERDVLIKKVGQLKQAGSEKAVELMNAREELQNMKNRIRNLGGDLGKAKRELGYMESQLAKDQMEINDFSGALTGYLMHKWPHDYAVQVQRLGDDGAWHTVSQTTYHLEMTARRKAAQLNAENKSDKTRYRTKKLASIKTDFFSQLEIAPERIMAAIDQATKASSLPGAFAKVGKDAVRELSKSKGFGRYQIHRSNIKGYQTENLAPLLSQYIAGFAGFVSKMEAAPRYFEVLGTVDAAQRPRLYEKLREDTKYILGNSEDFHTAKTYAFSMYLANDLGFLLTNGTQNYTVGIGELSKILQGHEKIWRPEVMMIRAQNDWLSHITGERAEKTGIQKMIGKLEDAFAPILNITRKFGGEKENKGVTDEELAAVNYYLEHGKLGGEMAGEMMGFKNNPLFRGFSNGFRKAMFLTTSMVERDVNRVPAFLAARRLWQERWDKANAPYTTETLNAKALETSETIHFRGGRHDRPMIMQNRWANMLLAMTNYTTNYLKLLYHNAKLIGTVEAREAFKDGATMKEAMKHVQFKTDEFIALLHMMKWQFLFGGLLGLPLAKSIGRLLNLLGVDDDEQDKEPPTKTDIAVQRGIPALLGWDMSFQTGVDLPFVSNVLDDPKNAIKYGGVVGGSIQRMFTAKDLAEAGRWQEAIGKALPDFMGHLFTAHYGNTVGVRSSTGAFLKDSQGENFNFSAIEALAESLGINTTRKSLAWQQRYDANALNQKQKDEKTGYNKRIENALLQGDEAKAKAIEAEGEKAGVLDSDDQDTGVRNVIRGKYGIGKNLPKRISSFASAKGIKVWMEKVSDKEKQLYIDNSSTTLTQELADWQLAAEQPGMTKRELGKYFKEQGLTSRTDRSGWANESAYEGYLYRSAAVKLENEGKSIAQAFAAAKEGMDKKEVFMKARVNYKLGMLRAGDIDELGEMGLIGNVKGMKEFVAMTYEEVEAKFGKEFRRQLETDERKAKLKFDRRGM